MRSRFAGALLLAAALTACGTTVPRSSSTTASGQEPSSDGLGKLTSPGTPQQQVRGDLPGSGPSVGGPDAAPGSASSPSSAPVVTGTGPAVVPGATDRSPLTVGVTYINNEQTAQALGASDPATVTKQSIVRALARGINARGGLHGRMLKLVEYEWNSQSTNWNQDAATACARFTQDTKVAVVLDLAFGTIGGFRTCLQKAGVLSLQSSPEGDEVSSREATLHANPYGMTADRSYSAVVRGLVATGYLTAKSKVGVITETCPETGRAWTRTVKPLMRSLGLQAPVEATLSCTTSFAAAGPAASAISNDVLRFRSAGVDRVLFVSDNEAVVLLLFATAADSQAYTPGYLLSSAALTQALRSQLPVSQQPQLHGVGHQPFNDVDGSVPNDVDNRCRALAKAGGISSAAYADLNLLFFECGPFLLLDAALGLTGGSAAATELASAIGRLDASFQAPGLLGGTTRFGSTRRDGPERVRVFGYVASCACMRYSGPTSTAS